MAELVTKSDLPAVRQDMAAMEQKLQLAIDNMALRLTTRLGVMMAAAVAALAAILRLT